MAPTGRMLRPEVVVSHMIDLTQLPATKPNAKELGSLLRGNQLEWSVRLRAAMESLSAKRKVPGIPPARVRVAVVPSRGLVLLWPVTARDRRGFLVVTSPAGRRVRTDLTRAFAAMGISLPPEVVVEVPITTYRHPQFGECLALHLAVAEFLPEQSKTATSRQL